MMGGVETLIRSLHRLFPGENYELYEHHPSYEHFAEHESVSYRAFGANGKLASKLNQVKALGQIDLQAGDVVILFHPNDLLYLPISVMRKCRIVLVQTNKFSVYFKPFSKLVMQLLHRVIDVFTVYTAQDQQALVALFPQLENKIKVIPRGCKLASANRVSQVGKRLVTIARIDEEQKNFTSMLEAMKKLPQDYVLHIYGDGTDSEVASLKAALNTIPNVEFKGPTSDVESTLKQYSLFLMTSRYEGFGQTLIEARSQGLPIVAFDTFDALSWIVDEGENGYKVPFNDETVLSERIIQICEDADLYQAFSTRALEKATETESAVVDRLWIEALA